MHGGRGARAPGLLVTELLTTSDMLLLVLLLVLLQAAHSTTFRRTTPSGPLWVPIGGLPLLHNVTWLHVPKCGSTFENVLLRGACRASTKHPFIEAGLVRDVLASHCPTAFNRFANGHGQLRPSDLLEGVQLVTLLRKPASVSYTHLRAHETPEHLV